MANVQQESSYHKILETWQQCWDSAKEESLILNRHSKLQIKLPKVEALRWLLMTIGKNITMKLN